MFKAIKFLLTASAVATLLACGGGGGGGVGSTASVPAASTLTGTASVGAPLANAVITLTGANGKTLTATAGADGSYTFADISALTAPIVLTATGIAGGNTITYSSVALVINTGTSTVANVSPITDAIVLQSTGASGPELAADPSKIQAIDKTKVQQVTQIIAKSLANVLEGIKTGSSNGYDPITNIYVANGIAPQDKLLDLVSISSSAQLVGSTLTINIVVTDKTGANGSINISPSTTTGTVQVLPATSASVSSLPIEKIANLFSSIATLASTQTGLSSSAFADLINDNFLRYGKNKTQMLAAITSPSSNYLGWKLANPVIISCLPSGACLVGDTETWQGSVSPNSIWIIWNSSKGVWQWYGNQQQNLNIGFSSSVKKTDSNNAIVAGLDFSIRDIEKIYPYNSASATFQDRNGVVDYVVNFANKPACPNTSPTYWGLPIDNAANANNSTFCGNWILYQDETILSTINSKIALGNYQLIVKAYTSNNRTGSSVQSIKTLSMPLLTKSQVVPSDFPAVTISKDGTGPYLSIQYANNFNQIGSVCLSSALSPKYCDMDILPTHTSVYGYTGKGLQTTYRPIAADNWSASDVIRSYYVHAQDRFGRDLRVQN